MHTASSGHGAVLSQPPPRTGTEKRAEGGGGVEGTGENIFYKNRKFSRGEGGVSVRDASVGGEKSVGKWSTYRQR